MITSCCPENRIIQLYSQQQLLMSKDYTPGTGDIIHSNPLNSQRESGPLSPQLSHRPEDAAQARPPPTTERTGAVLRGPLGPFRPGATAPGAKVPSQPPGHHSRAPPAADPRGSPVRCAPVPPGLCSHRPLPSAHLLEQFKAPYKYLLPGNLPDFYSTSHSDDFPLLSSVTYSISLCTDVFEFTYDPYHHPPVNPFGPPHPSADHSIGVS